MGWWSDYGPGSYDYGSDDYDYGSELEFGSDSGEYNSGDSWEGSGVDHSDEYSNEEAEDREVPVWQAIEECHGDEISVVANSLATLEAHSRSGDVTWPLRGTEKVLGDWEEGERYAGFENAPDVNAEAAAALASAFRLVATFQWAKHIDQGYDRAHAQCQLKDLECAVECAHTVLLFMLGRLEAGEVLPRVSERG